MPKKPGRPSKASNIYRPKPSSAEIDELLKAPYLIRDNNGDCHGRYDLNSLFAALEKLRAQYPKLKFKHEYLASGSHYVVWNGKTGGHR